MIEWNHLLKETIMIRRGKEKIMKKCERILFIFNTILNLTFINGVGSEWEACFKRKISVVISKP